MIFLKVHAAFYNIQLPSFSASHNIGQLSQWDHVWLPDDGILKWRNM
jgi:hypothetical protein